VDGNSADGVYKIDSWESFDTVPAELGRPYEYEDFIEGTILSVSAPLIHYDNRPRRATVRAELRTEVVDRLT
jgi:hypothetical protein